MFPSCKKYFSLFFLFSCMILQSSFAEVIEKVVIMGNTRSKRESIIKWGGIVEGQDYSAEEIQEIIEKIKRAYQFNIKSIRFENKMMTIDIEEKWSLFPVPMLSQSGNYYSRGLLLYENNFLGRLGTIAPGVFWTNSGINGVFYFQEDNLIAPYWGMKLIALHKSDLTEFERKNNSISSFESRTDTLILTPNYNKGKHDHKLGPIYVKKKIYSSEGVQLFNSERLGLYYRHVFSNFQKLPIQFDGFTAAYDFFIMPDRSGAYEVSQGGEAQYSIPNNRNFFISQIHFHHTNRQDFTSPKILGGNDGHRGYDRESLPVRKNIGFMLQQQFHLFNQFYGSPFYELNHFELIKPILSGASFTESTVGFNFSYYFKTISIPALIIEFARNIDDKSNHLHLNVGLKL